VEYRQPCAFELCGVTLGTACRRGHELHALVDDELRDARIAHERLRDVHAERLVGELAHLLDLFADRVEFARRRLDDAEPAGVRHGGGELRPRDPSHRRLNDRNLDTQHLRHAVLEQHVFPLD
jgi:hypothetical protein